MRAHVAVTADRWHLATPQAPSCVSRLNAAVLTCEYKRHEDAQPLLDVSSTHISGRTFNASSSMAQERLTAKEAMGHPYFAPVRQRNGIAS